MQIGIIYKKALKTFIIYIYMFIGNIYQKILDIYGNICYNVLEDKAKEKTDGYFQPV